MYAVLAAGGSLVNGSFTVSIVFMEPPSGVPKRFVGSLWIGFVCGVFVLINEMEAAESRNAVVDSNLAGLSQPGVSFGSRFAKKVSFVCGNRSVILLTLRS